MYIIRSKLLELSFVNYAAPLAINRNISCKEIKISQPLVCLQFHLFFVSFSVPSFVVLLPFHMWMCLILTKMHHCYLLLLTLTGHCDPDLMNQFDTEVAASTWYNFTISIGILITW